MGLFRPYERQEHDETTPSSTESDAGAGKKHIPTPTRKEAEAARRERLNPTLSPAQQRARDREAKAKGREEQWAKVDNDPARILLRDFIDSRRGLAQWWMPIIMAALVLALVVMYVFPTASIVATAVPYAALIVMAVHMTLLWRQFRTLLAERLPNASRRGLGTYMVNRMISVRRFRMPAPRVKPGDQI